MTERFTAETGIALDMQTLGRDEIRTKIVTADGKLIAMPYDNDCRIRIVNTAEACPPTLATSR